MIRNINEGAPHLMYDASSIIVSEKENRTNFDFLKKFLLKNIESVENKKESSDIKKNLGIEKAITKKKTTETICNVYDKSSSDFSPSICLYSTDIHIVSRNDSSIYNEKLDGSIYLIKNSSDNETYGEVSLRENGNIAINGNKILIGDYEREENKKSGEGTSVIIGKGGELNSLVLGEKLVSMLSELIEINKESFKAISAALEKTQQNFDNCNDNFNSIKNWSDTHTHIASALSAPTATSLPISNPPVILDTDKISDGAGIIVNQIEPKLTDKLENLIVKMDNILSKFAKTS
jgi:hypothetical protein